MNDLNSLLSALELTGGARILLRSDQRPHLIVGDTRHDLGDRSRVDDDRSSKRLADQVLSPAGKNALAEQRAAIESLPEVTLLFPFVLWCGELDRKCPWSYSGTRPPIPVASRHHPPQRAPLPPAMVPGLAPTPEPPPTVPGPRRLNPDEQRTLQHSGNVSRTSSMD